jgi:hypothetical protein
VGCIKAGKAAPELIRHGLPKVSATGERQTTFRLHHRKTQIFAELIGSDICAALGIVASGPPDSGHGVLSSAAALSGLPRCEENDNYPTIARLNVHWRVVECKNSIQWILQRRQGKRWRGAWFCRTREALIRGAREHAGQIGGDALIVLLRLPERFPEAQS